MKTFFNYLHLVLLPLFSVQSIFSGMITSNVKNISCDEIIFFQTDPLHKVHSNLCLCCNNKFDINYDQNNVPSKNQMIKKILSCFPKEHTLQF